MKKIFYSSLIFISILISHKSFAGKDSGGGGGVIYRHGHPILLDFLNIDSQFQDSTTYLKWTASRFEKIPPVISFEPNGEDEARKNNAAVDFTLSILDTWKDMTHPDWPKTIHNPIGQMIHNVLDNHIDWTFIDGQLPEYVLFLPKGVGKNDVVKLAAYYSKIERDFHVQISTSTWNELGIWGQAGLLIHEGLRHLQIAYQANFDEQSLQQVTAIVMLCQPQEQLQLYTFYLILNQRDLAEQTYGNFDQVIHNFCHQRVD